MPAWPRPLHVDQELDAATLAAPHRGRRAAARDQRGLPAAVLPAAQRAGGGDAAASPRLLAGGHRRRPRAARRLGPARRRGVRPLLGRAAPGLPSPRHGGAPLRAARPRRGRRSGRQRDAAAGDESEAAYRAGRARLRGLANLPAAVSVSASAPTCSAAASPTLPAPPPWPASGPNDRRRGRQDRAIRGPTRRPDFGLTAAGAASSTPTGCRSLEISAVWLFSPALPVPRTTRPAIMRWREGRNAASSSPLLGRGVRAASSSSEGVTLHGTRRRPHPDPLQGEREKTFGPPRCGWRGAGRARISWGTGE